jgi:peptidoglycan/xylan/chitin deacetylase (PgdA/CDA1 family)
MARKLGSTSAWLLTLAVMAAIVIGLAIAITWDTDAPDSSEPPAPQATPDEVAGALAQQLSPTSPPQTPVATETVVETPVVMVASPTPTSMPPPPAIAQPDVAEPRPVSQATAASMPIAMPTPREVYSWTLQVPILMYHYISDPPQNADKYRLDLSTSPALFREQLTFLVENGYETVDLYDLTLAIVDKSILPDKPVIITLDDGYRDNYVNAFPILQELGMTATFFVTTEFIDQNNPAYMDWAMVEEMAAAGMRIEPHSKTHPDLTIHDRDFIVWEVLGSQETIASHIGYRPRYFAYPGGRYNDEVMQIVSELDFWGAVTTGNGNWHGFNDRFEWGRVRMRNVTSVTDMSAMIN